MSGRKTGRGWRALVGLAAVLVAACGSATAGGSGGLSGKTILFDFLWQVKGESSFAIQDFEQGAELAVSDINSHGGINGAKVQYKRYAASPVDASQQIQQVLDACADHPVAAFGPPVDEPSLTTEKKCGIPWMATSSLADSRYGQNPNVSAGRFWVGPDITGYTQAMVKYVTQTLHAKKIAYLHTNDSSGTALVPVMKQEIQAAGATLTVERSYSVTATDLTDQVLATRGSDAVISISYENPQAVLVNQMAQNGIDIPVVGYTVTYPDVADNLVHPDALNLLYGSTGCNVYANGSAATKTFVSRFQSAYHSPVTEHAATTYDELEVVAQAIRNANSTNPQKVIHQLQNDTFHIGACGQTYRSDSSHNMAHTIFLHTFAGGDIKLVGTETVPPYKAS